jgi:hypothetical protein
MCVILIYSPPRTLYDRPYYSLHATGIFTRRSGPGEGLLGGGSRSGVERFSGAPFYPAQAWSKRLESNVATLSLGSLRYEVVHFGTSASRYHAGRMRASIALDEDIYDAAQHWSRVSGEGLGKVISKLTRRGPEPKRPPANRERRLPTAL